MFFLFACLDKLAISKMGPTLKGKEFAPKGANSFL